MALKKTSAKMLKQARLVLAFLAMMQFWSIPHEKTMHAIELFGKYVIPHFRQSVTPGESAAAGGA